ncbi:MAG: PepSY domain-containing protein [Nanoarchaeota archaeon]|nr:PepSY domain-containing protein [Nanoarchaeota archaeon]
MKRAIVLIIISLLLFSLVSAVGLTSRVTEDNPDSISQGGNSNEGNSGDGNEDDVGCDNYRYSNCPEGCIKKCISSSSVTTDCDGIGSCSENETEIEKENECEGWNCTKWSACLNGMKTRNCIQTTNTCSGELEAPKLTKVCEEKERIKVRARITECPEECTCSGSTIKCMLASGREMTITAGNSGNVIVQIKGVNMTTNVTLYKSDDGKVYGVFKNNETKQVKMFPDQIREKIKERTKVKVENENIILDDKGTYQYEAKKDSRLLGFIPIKIAVKAYINPQTGEIIYSKEKWWNFLSKDVEEDPRLIVRSCKTIIGEENNCCKIRGYDLYNTERSECEFSS